MDILAWKCVAASFTVVGMGCAALSVSNITSSALTGISRNPSSAKDMMTYTLMGMAMSEAMGLLALLVSLLILFAL